MLLSSFGIFVSSFVLCFYIVPVLIKIANKFNLYDHPTEIKRHGRKVPYLGGGAILLGMLIPISLFLPDFIEKPKFINAFLVIMILSFLQGLDDDLFNRSALRKFLIEFFHCALLIYYTGFYLPLGSMFTHISFPPYISYIITLVSAVGIVNAYNLIDGADGLAGSISLIASIFYAICFYMDANYFFFFLALSLSGVLIAFLLYNKPPAHIFMGDAGSLYIGMLLATFTMVFIEGKSTALSLSISNRIILSFSFLSIPILDMTRLFAFRIYHRVSPFKGDNNHIHHIMAKVGFTGNQTLLIITTFMILNVGIAFLSLNKSWLGFVLINVCFYIILIQVLRQLNTFLMRRGYNLLGTVDSETESTKEQETA